MKWETVRLADVCSKIGSGSTPKGGSGVYVESGTSFIRSQNVYNLHFSYNGLAFIDDNSAQKLKGVTVNELDVLLNITGDSVARTCIVPKNVIPARVNQHVAIIRVFQERINPYFLNYYLASPFMQSFMLGLAVGKGTSRNAMTKEMIENFEVPCPSLEVQNKIVSILKDIDLLIENNQKQIKLLEEAAQRLYKEWFIELRFPGHEDVKIVDGVPEGWRYKSIGDIVVTMSGGTPSRTKKEYYDGSVKWIKTKELNDSFVFDTEEKITEIGLEKSSAKLFPKGSIIMAMYGATIGKLAIAGAEMSSNQACCVFDTKKFPHGKEYLFIWLLQNRNTLINKGYGSAQQNLSQEIIKSTVLLVPSEDILKQFCDAAEPIFKKIANCELSNLSLQEARDRLLPKLISGEIEV